MNFRDPLEIKLKSDGNTIEKAVIDFFYLKPTPIKDEEIGMYKPSLALELKKFSLEHYDKEFGDKVLVGALKQLASKHNNVSVREIKYCLEQVIEKNKLKPFNIHELSQFIKRYESDKKKVTEAYQAVKEKLWKKEETKQKAYTFLQQALKKNSEGQHLTIYEKAAIGNDFSKKWVKKQIESLKKEVENSLEAMQTELDKRRKGGFESFINDPEQNYPVIWNEMLLFGTLAFNQLEKK